MLKCPFLPEPLTLLNRFSHLRRPNRTSSVVTDGHLQCICHIMLPCVGLTQRAAHTDFTLTSILLFFLPQIRFLFLHVDSFASLSSSPARLSRGRQHFLWEQEGMNGLGGGARGGGPGFAASHALIDLV